ncbi:hypothetical protein O2W14_02690 [Modestobacter sp. VKM Ac-2986]|uniref:DUF1700 domain-containing protein n=1 Tax=Modestobacter sp. VKM Ac-2986 TaxID=3004140 RepID=UPI0022AA3E94|nr:hypothetical protein [Modestobacter sp. VKM Ac-2986]MCZ2827743.1 hypothetical protein [Modestobacter sp. VKM Ac-2986]
MTAPIAPGTQEARDYLADVEHELADLPADERAALLEDLEQHLAALAEEGDDCPLVIRLGSPAAYAEELRAAAGLPAQGGARPAPRRDELRRLLAQVEAHPLTGEVRRLWAELRPAWWVLRGYLLIALPSALAGQWDFPVPAALGSHVLGLLLVVGAIAGSVVLGRRQLTPSATRLLTVGGAVLALLSFLVAVGGTQSSTYVDYATPVVYDQAVGDFPLVSRYGPVTDVLPYAADGTPLQGVLLYDQDGRPLQVGVQEWWADGCSRVLRQPLAADGVPVPHAFPQTYVLDPTGGGLEDPALCDLVTDRPEVSLPVFPSAAATGTPAVPTSAVPTSAVPTSAVPAPAPTSALPTGAVPTPAPAPATPTGAAGN